MLLPEYVRCPPTAAAVDLAEEAQEGRLLTNFIIVAVSQTNRVKKCQVSSRNRRVDKLCLTYLVLCAEMDIFKAVESGNREQILKFVSQINDANQVLNPHINDMFYCLSLTYIRFRKETRR